MARLVALMLWVFGGRGAALAEGLPEAARQRIAENKTAFLEAAATAINWFDDARGIDAAAIDDFIASERAARRADVYGLLLSADLTADSAISGDEVVRIAPSLSPRLRGRLIARAAAADGNGDGTVDAAELELFAEAEALRLVPDKDREDLRLILLFDSDGDGWVSFAEVKAGLAGIAA